VVLSDRAAAGKELMKRGISAGGSASLPRLAQTCPYVLCGGAPSESRNVLLLL